MRDFPNATKRPWKLAKVDEKIICGKDVEVARATVIRNGGPLSVLVAVDNAALIVHAVNTLEEREKLLILAAVHIGNLLQVAARNEDGHVIKSARAFLADLEARNA